MAAAAAAADLIANGGLDASVQADGWDFTLSPPPADATFSWSSDDAAGAADSGSIELVSQQQGLANAGPACFMVVAGAAYEFGFQGKLADGSDTAATMACATYTNGDCSSAATWIGWRQVALTGSWAPGAPVSGYVPADARSVRCSLQATSQNGQRGFVARFDDVYFLSALERIFADGFDTILP